MRWTLPLLLVAACGPTTPPPVLEQPVANASAPAPPADPKVALAEAGVTDAGTEEAGSTSTNDVPASKPPPPDECTPVGIALEKSVRTKLKDCYRDGKKKDPNLQGTLKVSIDVDTMGKITGTRLHDSTLPKPVGECMLKVIKDAKPAPADAAKCAGKSITIPMAFPTPQ